MPARLAVSPLSFFHVFPVPAVPVPTESSWQSCSALSDALLFSKTLPVEPESAKKPSYTS